MHKKLKSFLADDAFFTVLLLIFVGLISFGLGRQSLAENRQITTENNTAGVVFSESARLLPAKTEAVSETLRVVTSRSGTKYHRLECSGASRIKEENKVFFDSVELAKAAGYTPAANCPGLN